jgi:hypothetical protein
MEIDPDVLAWQKDIEGVNIEPFLGEEDYEEYYEEELYDELEFDDDEEFTEERIREILRGWEENNRNWGEDPDCDCIMCRAARRLEVGEVD